MTQMKLPREERPPLRVLFTFGLNAAFYDADAEHVNAMVQAVSGALTDLGERFGVHVIAGIDEDLLHVGRTAGPAGGFTLIADVPSYAAVTQICNLVRETPVLEDRLWRYATVEARIGRPLLLGGLESPSGD